MPVSKTKTGEKLIEPDSEVKNKPWAPPAITISEANALQALERGEATPEQQIKALKWVVNKCAATYDLNYRPDSARDTDFSLGRAFVGQQIVRWLKTNLAIYKEKDDE